MSEEKQYVVVMLEQEDFGIDIQQIETIIRMRDITRVPKAPSFIKGVVNLRGDIIPVMSLRLKFNLSPDEYTPDTRIVIIKTEEHSIGMIVDRVKEVVEFSKDSIETLQRLAIGDEQNWTQGVGKTEGEVVTLLNVNALLDEILDA
ncbi:MAG: chemotaxis protein CheW [Epulopiscium sp.]|nr:chemotaxis protein CheW [Candidatus Epulonipiscium sp.]